jgi:hypothetical protein
MHSSAFLTGLRCCWFCVSVHGVLCRPIQGPAVKLGLEVVVAKSRRYPGVLSSLCKEYRLLEYYAVWLL